MGGITVEKVGDELVCDTAFEGEARVLLDDSASQDVNLLCVVSLTLCVTYPVIEVRHERSRVTVGATTTGTARRETKHLVEVPGVRAEEFFRMERLSASLSSQDQIERILVNPVKRLDRTGFHYLKMTENNNKKDQEDEKATEGGTAYAGDGMVVADNDRLGGEESLAPPPTPFVQYGGSTEVSGDGYRRVGSFREKYQCPSSRFRNLVSIPYQRIG